jgi:glycosyltransferase involved in cell wall biosynthesis
MRAGLTDLPGTVRPGADVPALHRLWRCLPPGPRRWALLTATRALAPRPDRAPPPPAGGLVVAGELGRASGVGEVARLMLDGLAMLGVAAWPVVVAARPTLRRASLPASGALPIASAAPLLLHVNALELPAVLRALPRGLPHGRRVIGYWTWDLPVAPPAWRGSVAFVHEIWTLSRFSQAALEPLLPGRVRCVPPPLAALPPRPAPLDRAAFALPAGAVVVLVAFSLASSFARKNPLAAIAAHRLAFGDRADRVLLLKIAEAGSFPADFARLRAAAAGAANIRFETRTLPPADRFALLRTADIVLSLHRSEGLGLVPAEAMLLGRPVVATGWSGTLDYMDADCAALVDYRLVPADDPRGVFVTPGACWAEPDVGAAADWLRRLADDAALRAALGARGYAMASSRLGINPLRAAVVALGLAAGPR